MARRTNDERAATTRSALIAAGRSAFLERGFAAAGAPEICAAAGVTRGALQHHFGDKRGLFRAIIEVEAAAVAAEIDGCAIMDGSALASLVAGGAAFLDAMASPGRVRLLLREAPAVLDATELHAIDARNGVRTLIEGLEAAQVNRPATGLPVPALAELLSAAYDRAASLIDGGAPRQPLEAALRRLLTAGLAEQPPLG